jgi:hypothetical protein
MPVIYQKARSINMDKKNYDLKKQKISIPVSYLLLGFKPMQSQFLTYFLKFVVLNKIKNLLNFLLIN